MKIAQIICQFRPYKGGMNEVAYYFSKELVKKGNEVVVFTPLYDKNLPVVEKIDGFIIKRIKPFFSFGNAAFIPKLWKELNNFDIVHLHYPFFGAAEIIWLKKIFGKKKFKLVITYHMDVVGKGIIRELFSFHTLFIMPKILKCADKITISSMDYFQASNAMDLRLGMEKKWLKNFDKNNIIELPFGVEKKNFTPLEKDKSLMAKYNLEDDDKVILIIAALDSAHYFKGFDYLLKAFKLVLASPENENWRRKNLKIISIGDGDLKSYYINLASQLNINKQVIFAGKVDDNEKIKLINLSYMNILPSTEKSEAFGVVLIESMACAKPVIASNLPGVRTVVEDGISGLLCEPKNEENLAGKIKYLLDMPYIARQMGWKGREKVENIYNWGRIGEKIREIYKNIDR